MKKDFEIPEIKVKGLRTSKVLAELPVLTQSAGQTRDNALELRDYEWEREYRHWRGFTPGN